MAGIIRRRTKAQSDQELVATQDGFLGGMNCDLPADSVDATEVPYLENFWAMRSGLKTRPGVKSLMDVADLFTISLGRTIVGILAHLQTASRYHVFAGKDDSGDPIQFWVHLDASGDIDSSGVIAFPDDSATYTYPGIKLFASNNVLYLAATSKMQAVQLSSGGLPTGTGWTLAAGNVWKNISEVMSLAGGQTTPIDGYQYRTLVVARVKDGTMILKEDINPNFVTIYQGDGYWGNGSYLSGNMPAITSGNYTDITALQTSGYTHFAIYRTRDLSGRSFSGEPTGVLPDPEQYWFAGEFNISQALAGYYTYSPAVTYPAEWMYNDEEVILLGNLLSTRFKEYYQPTTILDVAHGYVFYASAYFGTSTVHYSPTLPTYAVLRPTAVQKMQFNGNVTCIREAAGALMIFTKDSVNVIRTAPSIDSGNTEYGESVGQYSESDVLSVSTAVGVMSDTAVSQDVNGRVFMFCSDHSVRQFDGAEMSSDLAQDKVSSLLKLIDPSKCVVKSTPSGEIYLWDGVGNMCLRFSASESKGFGWSLISGDGWPALTADSSTGSFFVEHVGKYLISTIDGTEVVCIEYDVHKDLPGVDGFEVSRGSSIDQRTAGDTAILPKVLTRAITGTSKHYYVEHQQTIFCEQPFDVDEMDGFARKCTLYINAEAVASGVELVNVLRDPTAFEKRAVGTSLQVMAEWNTGGFFLSEFSTWFQSKNQRSLSFVMPSNEDVKTFNTGVVFRIDRTTPWTDSVSKSYATGRDSGDAIEVELGSDGMYSALRADADTPMSDTTLDETYFEEATLAVRCKMSESATEGQTIQAAMLGVSDGVSVVSTSPHMSIQKLSGVEIFQGVQMSNTDILTSASDSPSIPVFVFSFNRVGTSCVYYIDADDKVHKRAISNTLSIPFLNSLSGAVIVVSKGSGAAKPTFENLRLLNHTVTEDEATDYLLAENHLADKYKSAKKYFTEIPRV